MKSCHRCQHPWTESGPPGFNNTCAQCGMALHACANCRHFVSKGQVRCMIPGTERVLDWRAGNRCKSFEFSNVSGNMPKSPEETWIAKAAEGGGSARDVWNNLFKP